MTWFKRLVSGSRRRYSTQPHSARRKLLEKIYSPAFSKLEKDSPEYQALARSGRVWENWFKPQSIEPYLAAQGKIASLLAAADKQKASFSRRGDFFKSATRALVKEYSHQSTAIERNTLTIGDSLIIEGELEKQLFTTINDIPGMTTETLANLTLPSSEALLPGKDSAQVTEIRNHIIISRYLTEVGLVNPGTAGISLTDIKQLSRVMLAGTRAELLYAVAWGKRVPLGEFRTLPIRVRSNLLRIFPYHEEVPACMDRFITWRNDFHASSKLHPLVLATQLFVYFVHIHPFLDGNGRVGRVLMADYLIRQGYLPVIFRELERENYIKMVSDAQDGKPDGLCEAVALTQAEMLFTISLR